MKRTGMNSARKRQVFAALLKRDGDRCHYCDVVMEPTRPFDGAVSVRTMTIDHVVPVSLGGGNVQSNFVLACRKCNGDRGDKYIYCNCDFCFDARFEWS